MIDVILGLQWGDEGKGKIVDYFAKDYQLIARFQGGPNAGHTLYKDGKKIVLHQIPSGIFHEGIQNLIGNGVVLDPVTLQKEAAAVAGFGVDVSNNLLVSKRTQLILPSHRVLDKASEQAKGKNKIGSTLKGIGPAYMDKTGRNGLRAGDVLEKNFEQQYRQLKEKHLMVLHDAEAEKEIADMEPAFFESLEWLRKLKMVNGEYFIHQALTDGKKILAEGAQGSMLDIDFGTYPFVTSSNTISAGVCTGLGAAPRWIGKIIGITKAYCTRVGSGPFPTELLDETGEKLRAAGNEFGSTTGRPRRCGWLDLVALKYACMISGVTEIVMTKADVLDNMYELKLATAYSINENLTEEILYQMSDAVIEPQYMQLPGWNTDITQINNKDSFPDALKNYLGVLQELTKIPIRFLSNGPERNQLIAL